MDKIIQDPFWKQCQMALGAGILNGNFFKIFVSEDPNNKYAGGVVLFWKELPCGNKADFCFMLVNCTETRKGIAIWEEDVLASLIKKELIVTDGTNLFLEWADA